MTHKEILEKAIQKAIDGGWPTILASTMVEWNVYDDPINGRPGVAHKLADRLVGVWSFPEVIYDPLFAKALWGDYVIGNGEDNLELEDYFALMSRQQEWGSYYDGGPHFKGPIWKYHLQQMVISEDPIKYLGENI